jgi:hypothetical protein
VSLFLGVVCQESPEIKFTPDSGVLGNNAGNLNGRIGIDFNVPINRDFSISGQYNRDGNVFGRHHIDHYGFMGNYRIRF